MEVYIQQQHKNMFTMKDILNSLMHKIGDGSVPGNPQTETPKDTGSQVAIPSASKAPWPGLEVLSHKLQTKVWYEWCCTPT